MRRLPLHGSVPPLALVAVGALVGLVAPLRGTELTVFAAASLTDALREIGSAYERSSGNHVAFNFAGSSTLARQIAEGAPADVFLSADEATMNGLEARGEILAGTRAKLLSNTLSVVVSRDSTLAIAGPRDLERASLGVLALADPRSVPAGVYAEEYLRRAGVWPGVAGKVVPTENVRAALAAVEAGNADAAIVYRTDARISTKVRVAFEIPAAESPEIVYPIAVVRSSAHAAEARAFVEFVARPEALAAFARFGFLIAAPALRR